MNTLIKWGLGLGLAYALYESGILSSLTGGTLPAPAGPTATPAPPANPSGAPPTNPATTTPTKSLVLAAAQAATGVASPLLSFDQWNSYYQHIRGVAGPDPSIYLTASNRTENLSIDEWWADMQQAGLSGFVRSGMGGFVSREMEYTFENPWTPPPSGLVPIPQIPQAGY